MAGTLSDGPEDATERTRFLEVAAHELRNPMSSVKGMLGLVHRRLSAEGRSDSLTEIVRCASDEIDRLNALLNDVLDAFHGSANDLPYRADAVDMTRVASAALRPFQLAGGACRFVLAVPDGPVWVRGDARRLEDLLRNLLSNARKYSPDGGEVLLTVRADAGQVLIAVRDEGLGIPEDRLASIFGPFVRAVPDGGSDPGGLGLGLYISLGIVRHHGGRIWAKNRADRGACLQVTLPTAEDSVEVMPAAVDGGSGAPVAADDPHAAAG